MTRMVRRTFGLVALFASTAQPLSLELLRPEASARANGAKDVGDVPHPLHYPTGPTSFKEASDGEEGVLSGIEVSVQDIASVAHSEPDASGAAVFLQLFSVSYASMVRAKEGWASETSSSPETNPIWFTAVFDNFFRNQFGGIQRDERGDACLGDFLAAEICLQAWSCVQVDLLAAFPQQLELWLPTPVATNYRLEAFMSGSLCDTAQGMSAMGPPGARRLRRLNQVSEEVGGSLLHGRDLAGAQSLDFRLVFADAPSSWWASTVDLEGLLRPTRCWSEMMASALEFALHWTQSTALWLEFGVAHGRSLVFISKFLQKRAPHVTFHGFDSFEGIQEGWHRLQAQTFAMGGKAPDYVAGLLNVQVHVGYFTDTLPDLDPLPGPVAFAHIDSDLFASATEVLAHLKCRFVRGTILVFDEWFNYPGWHREGEYQAWQQFVSETGISWRPLGLFFEQAFGLVIESIASGC